MIERRIKNLLKLSGLIGIRQGYFLGRNWYELMREPYLTIKTLKESRDKSQIFLISLTALTPLFLYLVARVIYDLVRFGSLIVVTGNGFWTAILMQILILLYLGYWTIKVLGEK